MDLNMNEYKHSSTHSSTHAQPHLLDVDVLDLRAQLHPKHAAVGHHDSKRERVGGGTAAAGGCVGAPVAPPAFRRRAIGGGQHSVLRGVGVMKRRDTVQSDAAAAAAAVRPVPAPRRRAGAAAAVEHDGHRGGAGAGAGTIFGGGNVRKGHRHVRNETCRRAGTAVWRPQRRQLLRTSACVPVKRLPGGRHRCLVVSGANQQLGGTVGSAAGARPARRNELRSGVGKDAWRMLRGGERAGLLWRDPGWGGTACQR
eukprot:352120-Chlamydomonas_euryale.AAC.3